MRSDAESRHEKALPLALADIGAARAAKLLQAEGAIVHPPFATGAALGRPPSIQVTPAQVRGLLGAVVDDDEIGLSLRGLGFTVERKGASETERRIHRHAAGMAQRRQAARTCIEGIGRITGYDRIGAVQPPILDQAISSKSITTNGASRTQSSRSATAKQSFARAGGCGTRDVRASNASGCPARSPRSQPALGRPALHARFSLVPGLLGIVRRYQSEMPLRFFEIGHVFYGAPAPLRNGDGRLAARHAQARWRAGVARRRLPRFQGRVARASARACRARADAVSARREELHPGKTATLLVDGVDVATIGAVDPRLLATYEITGRVYAGVARMHDIPAYRVPRYKPASRFPAIERDLALLVAPDIPAIDIEHAARAGGDGVLADVRVFDEYRGPQIEPGKKSIALRVVLQRDDATLTDAEADRHIAAILASLAERCGAKIRE